MIPSLMIQLKLDSRSRKQKQKKKTITMFVLAPSDWFLSACDFSNLVFIISEGVISENRNSAYTIPSILFSQDRNALHFLSDYDFGSAANEKPVLKKLLY